MDNTEIIKSSINQYYKLNENENMIAEDNASIETYKQRIDKVLKKFNNIDSEFQKKINLYMFLKMISTDNEPDKMVNLSKQKIVAWVKKLGKEQQKEIFDLFLKSDKQNDKEDKIHYFPKNKQELLEIFQNLKDTESIHNFEKNINYDIQHIINKDINNYKKFNIYKNVLTFISFSNPYTCNYDSEKLHDYNIDIIQEKKILPLNSFFYIKEKEFIKANKNNKNFNQHGFYAIIFNNGFIQLCYPIYENHKIVKFEQAEGNMTSFLYDYDQSLAYQILDMLYNSNIKESYNEPEYYNDTKTYNNQSEDTILTSQIDKLNENTKKIANIYNSLIKENGSNFFNDNFNKELFVNFINNYKLYAETILVKKNWKNDNINIEKQLKPLKFNQTNSVYCKNLNTAKNFNSILESTKDLNKEISNIQNLPEAIKNICNLFNTYIAPFIDRFNKWLITIEKYSNMRY